MKRSKYSIGSTLGLISVIMLIIVSFWVLQSQLPQANHLLSSQQSYPPPIDPTEGAKLSVETGIPYPPPVDPTATPLTIAIPDATITPTVLSPNTPTQTPITLESQTGPLPSGLKIVYSETDGAKGYSSIWLVNVVDLLKQRKLITSISHKTGDGINGKISPDGTKIAYLVVPSNANERTARTVGGELWVIDVDGNNPHIIANQVIRLISWSPDNGSIAFMRFVQLENP